MSYIIPDVPASVSQLQVYENALIKKLRFDAAFHHDHNDQNGNADDKTDSHRFNPYQASYDEDELAEQENIDEWYFAVWTNSHRSNTWNQYICAILVVSHCKLFFLNSTVTVKQMMYCCFPFLQDGEENYSIKSWC